MTGRIGGSDFKRAGTILDTYNCSFAQIYLDASDSGVVLSGVTLNQLHSNIGVYPGPSPYVPTVALTHSSGWN
jgi:hypothetical protein